MWIFDIVKGMWTFIVNPEVKDVFVKRTKIISFIRKYLDDRGFLEVETPILQTVAGGANARPFVYASQCIGYRRLSAHSGGTLSEAASRRRALERVYELGKNFRMRGSIPATIQSLPCLKCTRHMQIMKI